MPSMRLPNNTPTEGGQNKRWTMKGFIDAIFRLCQSADCFIVCVVICSLTPVAFILILVVPKAMADDGITTMNEMMKILDEAMLNCNRHLASDLAPKDSNGNYYEVYCKGEWDQLTCWPNSAPGASVSVSCPEYIVDFDHSGKATRKCGLNGDWVTVGNGSKVWSDYSFCPTDSLTEGDIIEDIINGDPKTRSLILLYTVGYSFSLVALTFAMIILGYFKRLHCTRNYIHMHLFASFILRAAVIFVKDRVLYYGAGILDVTTNTGEKLETFPFPLEEFPNEKTSYYIGCKVVMTLFHYFVATNYYWILVEALYLHSLIFVAFFSDKKYLWRFTLTGWGVPVLFVVPWAIVRATLDDTACWDIAVSEYKWIYNGPIVVANVINFLLFLNIIRVLWYKMKERGSVGRTDNRRQYKKLAKSTLVLIPMFGVHAIVFIGMPDNIKSGIWWEIRMYFDLFFNSFQGFFVAIIYCFCNGEVQAEFRKTWERFNLSVEIQRGRRERSRSSVTMLTSFNSSASQQSRLSIGGQSNGRGGYCRANGAKNNLLISDGKSHHLKPEQNTSANRGKMECESSFITRPNESQNNNVTNEEEGIPLIKNRPPFIRSQSSGLPKGSDVIVPIAEERDLEEAFESAVEVHIQEQITCPAGSFRLADNDATSAEAKEKVDEFDDVISRDETTELRQKRMQRARRAESEDSGISSTSTYYVSMRGGSRGDGNLSHSDYCGDSEGISDDTRHSSDGEAYFDKQSTSHDKNITFTSENPPEETRTKIKCDVRESGV